MMRWAFWILLAIVLVTSAFVAPILLEDPGSVVIGFGAWELEMPLVAWLTLIIVLWIVLSLLWGVIRLPHRLLKRRRRERSRQQLENGFLALTEGDWARAEDMFSQSLSYKKSTAGLLGAARAAQGRSDWKARDAWLDQAQGHFGRKHFVTEFARARLALSEGRIDQAIELLEGLHLRKPKHLGVLRALLGAYQDAARWREVRELAPALRRAGMVDADKAQALVKLAAERELAQSDDYPGLQRAWKSLTKNQRKEPSLVLAYVNRAEGLGHYAYPSRLLDGLLDEHPDEAVLQAYRRSDETERAARIVACEKRLKKNPSQPEILEVLGFLYLDAREYEKAQQCLEQALAKRPGAEINMALGRLMDRQGESEAAARYYRNALQWQSQHEQRVLPSTNTSE